MPFSAPGPPPTPTVTPTMTTTTQTVLDREKIARITEQVLAEVRRTSPAAFERAVAGKAAFVEPAPLPADPPDAFRPRFGANGASLRPDELGLSPSRLPTVTCNVSNRHIHLRQDHLEQLFGPGAALEPRNELMQPGQFASKQTVSVIAGRGRVIENVRILGPCRKYSQVEIARTDAFFLGIQTSVRNSGLHEGTAGCTLVGPVGTLILEQGVIIADRHIHTPSPVAERLRLSNNDFVAVRVFHTEKPTLLERVRIRVADDFALEMHLDTDDANACGVSNADRLELQLPR